MNENACILCGKEDLKSIELPPQLPGVTSDCKPWPRIGSIAVCGFCGHIQKRLTKRWSSDVQQIYAQYEMYPLSDGVEQVLFNGLKPLARTSKLLDQFRQTTIIPDNGKLLDVGCGNGSFLRTFGKRYPGWRLFGFDQDSGNRDEVLQVPSVEDFYWGALDQINDRFDMVSMIYVIEHLPDPTSIMKTVRNLLNPEGVFIIQTSNFEQNPFDLCVVDHCSHFNLDTLAFLAQLSGFTVSIKTDTWIDKEIGVVLIPTEKHNTKLPPNAKLQLKPIIEKHFSWLQRVIKHAHNIAKDGNFGIFGTAIAGTWLAKVLGEEVGFFVDEDPLRQNKTHMGLTVFDPATVPEGNSVYLAFFSEIAGTLIKRLRTSYPGINFIKPPNY